jgi:hypothetical protein
LSDVLAAAAKSEERLPFVYAKKFYKTYLTREDGTVRETEMVEVAKKGTQNGQITPMRWSDVKRDQLLSQVLEPFYQNWKKGEETPVDGTPLDAWMADPELVTLLRSVGVRTVEDFGELPEHHALKLNVQGIREKQKRARDYLQSKTNVGDLEARLKSAEAENEDLKKRFAELEAKLTAAPTPEPKKRGRPRKVIDVTPNSGSGVPQTAGTQ